MLLSRVNVVRGTCVSSLSMPKTLTELFSCPPRVHDRHPFYVKMRMNESSYHMSGG